MERSAFEGKVILDIGCGPFLSALAFKNCLVYGLDPLIYKYAAAGFPLHTYEERGRFINVPSECIPVEDNFFDVIMSVNAIDHVNNFQRTADEIKRVMKPNGKFIMHVHYHRPYKTEPIAIDDDMFKKTYSFVNGLRKVKQTKQKVGHELNNEEWYVIWSNL